MVQLLTGPPRQQQDGAYMLLCSMQRVAVFKFAVSNELLYPPCIFHSQGILRKGLLMRLPERLRLQHEVAVSVAFTEGVADGVVREVAFKA